MTGINCSDCIRLARFYLILKSHETITNYKINVKNQKITRGANIIIAITYKPRSGLLPMKNTNFSIL